MKISNKGKNIHFMLIIGIVLTGILVFIETKSPAEENTVPTSEGWQIYQNQEMGLSLQYPPDWQVIPEHADSGGIRVDFQSSGAKFSILHRAFYYSEEKGRILTAKEIVTSVKNSSANTDVIEDSVQLAGSSAIRISYTTSIKSDQHARVTEIYDEDNDLWIFFIMYKYDKSEESHYDSLFRSFLSGLSLLRR
jgi:hypothetical protein